MRFEHPSFSYKVKRVKVTLVQALRLCTGLTAHRGSRGIALPFHDHGTRRGWVVSVTPRPLFTPGKDPVHIVQEAGWAPGPVWTGAENLAHTEIRSPDRPARTQSLKRLRYPAHLFTRQSQYILTGNTNSSPLADERRKINRGTACCLNLTQLQGSPHIGLLVITPPRLPPNFDLLSHQICHGSSSTLPNYATVLASLGRSTAESLRRSSYEKEVRLSESSDSVIITERTLYKQYTLILGPSDFILSPNKCWFRGQTPVNKDRLH